MKAQIHNKYVHTCTCTSLYVCMSKEKCVEGKVYMCWQSMIPGGRSTHQDHFFLTFRKTAQKRKEMIIISAGGVYTRGFSAHLVTAHSLIRNSAVWEGGESDWLL